MLETTIVLLLIGLAGGVAVGVQGPLASLISQRTGALESAFIVHVGGAIAALLLLAALRGGAMGQWRAVPWYAYGAGVLGLVVISSVSYTIPRMGVAPSLTLIIAGQLLVGVLLDQFGLLGAEIRPITLDKLFGLLVLTLGVWLLVR